VATETRERLYPRTESQIKADIAEARQRLAASIEQLAKESQPKTLKNNAVDQVKAMADAQYRSVKGEFVDENGVRVDRVAMIAGAAAGVVVTMLTLRGIYRGGQRRKVRSIARKQAAAIAGGPVKITVKKG
jgi:hypothetical protein